MCGIFGYLSKTTDAYGREEALLRGLHYLKHRGPDGMGHKTGPNYFLGHTRLSIIDLEHGDQPMMCKDSRYLISFNGEIYNHDELRSELKSKGFGFKTSSDTEVVLNSFIKWKLDAVARLEGMFSFAIFDSYTNQLHLVRDRYGIKPLFFSTDDNNIMFSSEANAIYESGFRKFELNEKHLNEYLIFGYIVGHETLHKTITEVSPGEIVSYANGKVERKVYWTPFDKTIPVPKDENEIIVELGTLLKERILKWTIGDNLEDVAILLSGGLDSSLVTKFASSKNLTLNTITACFPDDKHYDEKELTKVLTSTIDCNQSYVNLSDNYYVNNIEKLSSYTDIPIHNSNNVTLMSLCEKIKEFSDIKVVLCGEGADEVFGGYGRHRTITDEYDKTKSLEVLNFAYNRVAIPRLRLFTDDVDIKNSNRFEIAENLRSDQSINMLLELDQKTFLQSYLHRQDLIGMIYGLEIRTPFLDHKITEYANSLDGSLKVRNGIHKYILRKVAEKFLPHEIVWNKNKYQFIAPGARMFQDGALRELYLNMINGNAMIASYYDQEGMRRLLENHNPTEGEEYDHCNTLWRILATEFWLRNNTKYY